MRLLAYCHCLLTECPQPCIKLPTSCLLAVDSLTPKEELITAACLANVQVVSAMGAGTIRPISLGSGTMSCTLWKLVQRQSLCHALAESGVLFAQLLHLACGTNRSQTLCALCTSQFSVHTLAHALYSCLAGGRLDAAAVRLVDFFTETRNDRFAALLRKV